MYEDKERLWLGGWAGECGWVDQVALWLWYRLYYCLEFGFGRNGYLVCLPEEIGREEAMRVMRSAFFPFVL